MPSRPRHSRTRPTVFAGVGVGLLILAIMGALFAYGMVQNYLRGERFRGLVERQAGDWLGAEVKLAPLNWTGAAVYVDRANAEGSPESAVENLEAESLRTGVNLRALLAREVSFEPIEITRLNLKLKQSARSVEHPAPSSPGTWWQPRRVRLNGIKVGELQLDTPWMNLSQTRATLEPGSTSDFVLAGGRLQVPEFPEADLREARLRLANDSLHLLSCDLGIEGGGVVGVDGVVTWGNTSKVDLQARWKQVKLEHFLPERWRAVLQGKAGGDAHYVRSEQGMTLEGAIHSEDASVGVLPVLKLLADFTGSERFAQVPLQNLSADFSRQGEALELKKVVVESSGLIRLEGECRIERQTIEGNFMVGVSPSVLRWIPASYGQVFAEDRDGYRWTTMRVNGPLSQPNEDLSARLIAAIPGAVIEKGVEGAAQAERIIKEGVSGVLDTIFGK